MHNEIHWYQPDRERVSKASKWIAKNYPYNEELKVIKKMRLVNKIPALMELHERNHPNTLSHTFEDAFLATSLAFDYFVHLARKIRLSDQETVRLFMPKVEEIFLGALIHDIGKTAISSSIIDNKDILSDKEKEFLNLHSQLGSDILKRVKLGDIAYFCDEHHIGNSNSVIFTESELNSRHPLTEFVMTADVISGSMDPRRLYNKQPKTAMEVIDMINRKHASGKLSDGLTESFKRVVVDQNMFPPFFGTKIFGKSPVFMRLIKKYNLGDILNRNMVKRENKKSFA